MITSLRIQNLESHKDTSFEFSPGLNVFVGESDRGKSGSFRAYKWLTQNSPGGEWMRPLYWDGITTVTGTFLNPDLTVQRVRGKSENNYILNDEKPINAGTSVPSNIAALLDLDDVNLQTQIERAFLMFETSGERGRILNRIAGLDEIETTLSNAKQDVGKLTRQYEAEKATRKVKEEELADFAPIEEMEDKVAQIDAMQKLLLFSISRNRNLTKFQTDLKNVEDALVLKEPLLLSLPTLDGLNVKNNAILEGKNRILKLEKMLRSLSEIKRKESKENFAGVNEWFDHVEEMQDDLDKSKARVKKLKRLASNFSTIDQDILETEEDLKALQSKIPNVCTECGKQL